MQCFTCIMQDNIIECSGFGYSGFYGGQITPHRIVRARHYIILWAIYFTDTFVRSDWLLMRILKGVVKETFRWRRSFIRTWCHHKLKKQFFKRERWWNRCVLLNFNHISYILRHNTRTYLVSNIAGVKYTKNVK